MRIVTPIKTTCHGHKLSIETLKVFFSFFNDYPNCLTNFEEPLIFKWLILHHIFMLT